MHKGGFELTKLTYTRLEDNLIRHGGDRIIARRVLGYYMCGGYSGITCATELNQLFFFSKIEFSREKNGLFITSVDYWTDDAVQQCFSVVVVYVCTMFFL